MLQGTWISLLVRQSRTNAPIGWDEVVVGHDFGLVTPREIQRWALEQGFQGPRCLQLAALEELSEARDADCWRKRRALEPLAR